MKRLNQWILKHVTLSKTLTYRAVCIVVIMTVCYVFTRSFAASVYITVIQQTAQMVLYYYHEKAWNRWLGKH